MDKTPQQLDPKLKEAYDRVMGTVVTPHQPTAQTAPPPSETHSEPVPPVSPQPAPQITINNPSSTTAMASSPTTQVEKVQVGKKKKRVSPLIIFLGVIVFLAVYAVVWVKYFGLTVPYLNP